MFAYVLMHIVQGGENEYLICGLIQQQQLESDQSKIDKYKNTPDYYSIHCVGALPDRCCRRRCWWVLLMTTAALTDLFSLSAPDSTAIRLTAAPDDQ